MKSKYLYLAAGFAFMAGAVLELRPPRSVYPAVLDVIAGAIFLFLGFLPHKPRVKPPK